MLPSTKGRWQHRGRRALIIGGLLFALASGCDPVQRSRIVVNGNPDALVLEVRAVALAQGFTERSRDVAADERLFEKVYRTEGGGYHSITIFFSPIAKHRAAIELTEFPVDHITPELREIRSALEERLTR